jgi:GntR family histidine utilization transcriptional repressor
MMAFNLQKEEVGALPPLYQRIQGELEGRIMSGEWPPGHRIPFERELAEHYGCARMTINKVLSALVTAKLIERRRKVGSFVTMSAVQSAVLQIPDMREEITNRGQQYDYELISRHRLVTLSNVIGRGFLEHTPVLAVKCRHLANAKPFAMEERYISLAAVPQASSVDFSTISPSRWLVRHVLWTRAEHHIRAVNVTASIAKALAIPKGAAGLVVERRTWRNGDEITLVRQTFCGKLYELKTTFLP